MNTLLLLTLILIALRLLPFKLLSSSLKNCFLFSKSIILGIFLKTIPIGSFKIESKIFLDWFVLISLSFYFINIFIINFPFSQMKMNFSSWSIMGDSLTYEKALFEICCIYSTDSKLARVDIAVFSDLLYPLLSLIIAFFFFFKNSISSSCMI